MEDMKASLDTKNEPKYLNQAEAKYEVNKYILALIVSKYNEIEVIFFLNVNKIYGIIWGQCDPIQQSVLKGNDELLYKSKN